MLTTLVISLLVLQAHACTSDADCYGGKCLAAGACVCPPLWSGPLCQTLRLRPARVSAPGLLLPNTSTWGGGAVQDLSLIHI